MRKSRASPLRQVSVSKGKNIKWFKHYGSLGEKDFSQELIEKYGLQAYARYILLLETCTILHGDKIDGTYSVSVRVLCRKLLCKRQHLARILSELGQLMGFSCSVGPHVVTICIPILSELLKSDSNSWKQRRALDKEEEEEKDKEEEKELQRTAEVAVSSAPVLAIESQINKLDTELNRKIWDSYKTAYLERWQKEPIRNARVNKQISDIGKRLGQEAVEVVKFYVSHNKAFYVENTHSIGLCLQDAESLHTQWTRGQAITRNDVRQFEQADHYKQQIERIRRGQA